MSKITNLILLSTFFLLVDTTGFAAPGPPPPAPPPPPGLPMDTNIIILISVLIIYVLYKLQFNNKKASI